jgi:maltose alpha-D-glucosyltransferase/alpha-amylase
LPKRESYLEDDPFWYKDAIIYELHVKAFYDSNCDGIGDFKGLTKKFDYLESLGVTAIWVLPFYPSPLKDDGYDIAQYFDVHPDYGTLREFKEFLREAHARGIRVITELVLNHTSDQHPWFQRARNAKAGSIWRDFYVWSDTPDKYKDTRIIFTDFESSNWAWDPVAKAYYWHRFYSHQPDLNYDNPHVQKAVLKVIDNWMDMGIDGVRLDAVPYLFEREGTNCENLPETHVFLKKLRAHVNTKYKNKMFLAEANQWPEDAAAYFGKGDECHMAFHFPLMPRMFMSIWMEDRFPIIDIFEQTPPISETCQWALFLRNHDELTLEMVTDEERDYMYRIYATDPHARINLGIRRRLAPLLGNYRKKMEIMNFLLLSLPGTPIIYYGDEIGMGDNYYLGDRNGVRTPMQWSADRNAGFSRTNPQKLYLPIIIDPAYHYEAVNVENLEINHASILWWMKRVISMRKRFNAFGRGSIEFLNTENPKILAFIRQYQDENILVVVNLSRFAQVVELDLSRFSGYIPEEVFGGNKFPIIKDTPYLLTIGSHDYYWFLLQKEEEVIRMEDIFGFIPQLSVSKNWENVFQEKTKEKLEEEILPSYIVGCRWFGGKGQKIGQIRIIENIPIGKDGPVAHLLLLIRVRYIEGEPEIYLLPVSFSSGEEAEKIIEVRPHVIIARLGVGNTDGIIYEGVYSEEFHRLLFKMIERKQSIKGLRGHMIAYPGRLFKSFREKELLVEKSQVLKGEQSNTSILYGNTFYLKLFRRLAEGIHPDLEISRFLTEKASFQNIPPFIGAMEYRKPGVEPIVIGMLQAFIPNQGDAWTYTCDSLGRYFERALSKTSEIHEIPKAPRSFLEVASQEIPLLFKELIGGVYLEMTHLMGKRTAELHLNLSSDKKDPDFVPEPFSVLYQRSLFQSMQSLTKRSIGLLRKNIKNLPEDLKAEAEEMVNFENRIIGCFKTLLDKKISAMRTRVHGDYHLGQVLFTGNDFIIIDFEGEPARPISERRLKRSPLSDVAGMIRSFHYAAYNVILKRAVRPEDIHLMEPWAELWYRYVSGVFLSSYLKTVGNAPFLPMGREELDLLLQVFSLEKAVYELGYELNNRPNWIIIPLKGIKQFLAVQ